MRIGRTLLSLAALSTLGVASSGLLLANTMGAGETAKAQPMQCRDTKFALQTLGTGGPIAEGSRAGSSNVVWVHGKAAVLVDAGPGSFIRYGEAGIDFSDHRAILITHFHGDHVGGLAGLLNHGGFTTRTEPLPIAGPVGNEYFQTTDKMLSALVGKTGVLSYLFPYLDGSADLPLLKPINIDPSVTGLQPVLREPGLEVDAIGVHHGGAPALGYVVRHGGYTIVFAGDQSAQSEDFVESLRGTHPDILVMHNVISMAEGQPRGLHRDGRSIGEAAAAIAPKRLILSHNMLRALNDMDAVMAALRENYTGEVSMANDGDCFSIDPAG